MKFRELPPYQIILMAVAVLLIVVFGAYFAVTQLTTTKAPAEAATSTVPADLASQGNAEVIKSLESFEAPANLPLATEPLRTPDPNAPSSVNPFQR